VGRADPVVHHLVRHQRGTQDRARRPWRIRGVDFLNRLAKAEEWANTHPEEYTEVYSKTNGVAPDIATQVVAHGRATLGPVAPDVVSKVQSVSDLMHGIGSLPSNVDVASVTDTSVFLPAAN
jgi:sulfonate transport system substrate-binding protein